MSKPKTPARFALRIWFSFLRIFKFRQAAVERLTLFGKTCPERNSRSMRIKADKKVRIRIPRARSVNLCLFFRGASTLVLLAVISLAAGSSQDNRTNRENVLDPGTEYIQNFWSTANGLPQSSVNAVLQTRDGYLWV